MEREVLSIVAKYGPAIVGRPTVEYGTFLTVRIETSHPVETHPWYVDHSESHVTLEPQGLTPGEFRFMVAASVDPKLNDAWKGLTRDWDQD